MKSISKATVRGSVACKDIWSDHDNGVGFQQSSCPSGVVNFNGPAMTANIFRFVNMRIPLGNIVSVASMNMGQRTPSVCLLFVGDCHDQMVIPVAFVFAFQISLTGTHEDGETQI